MYKNIVNLMLLGVLISPVTAFSQKHKPNNKPITSTTSTPAPVGYVTVTPKTTPSADFLLSVEKQKNIQSEYKLNAIQMDNDYNTAKKKLQDDASAKLATEYAHYNLLLDAIKKENGWDKDTVVFDTNTSSFYKKVSIPTSIPVNATKK